MYRVVRPGARIICRRSAPNQGPRHRPDRLEVEDGRAAIEALLIRKWARELEYRLIKELWAFDADRIAVRFVYE